jgi:putative glutamine amidotransferase
MSPWMKRESPSRWSGSGSRMAPLPRILIAGRPARDQSYRPYLEAVRGAGGDPVLLLPGAEARRDPGAIRGLVLSCRGILFPGGVDIDPIQYGAAPHPKLGSVDPELDDAQFALARLALEEDVPVLGICRGLQVLGVAAGGSLFQDLPSERPSEVRHSVTEPKDFLAHDVEVVPGSRLAAASGGTRFMVNSRHHQAVQGAAGSDRIGPFAIVARAADGIVEGLEDARRRFLVAVQWHPENLVAAHQPSRGLFAAFLASCR